MNPLEDAINLYQSLIYSLQQESDRNLCVLSDPEFQSFRLYAFEKLPGFFEYNMGTELESEKVDEIEELLFQIDSEYSLLQPLTEILKSVVPTFNKNNKTVFLGSWGMAPGEIGWMIRYLNDHSTYKRYLTSSGITETEVDAYNEGYSTELNRSRACITNGSELVVNPK